MSDFAGIPIITNPLLTETKNVARSPSRAARRWARGIRKVTPYAVQPSLKVYRVGGKLVMHPATLDAMKRSAGQ